MAFTFFQRLTDSGDRNIRINATDIDGSDLFEEIIKDAAYPRDMVERENRKKIKKGGFFL